MKRIKMLTAVTMTAAIFSVPMMLSVPAMAQSASTAKAKPAKRHKETAEEIQMRELREKTDAQLAAQQAEIDALKAAIAGKDAQVSTAQQTATDAAAQAATAAASAAQANAAAAAAAAKVEAVSSSVTDLKSTDQGLQETVVANQAKVQEEIETPATLHYKGITITPVAFFAFENVYRQRSVNSDVNTPFNSIPVPGANQGHVSELNFSGRQSRLGGLFTGDAGKFKLAGYFEGDFLGAGTTSNGNQSNSYVFRQRQFWGQAAMKNGFTVTGGQMWSLATETSISTNNAKEKLPTEVDAQYTVGFSWVRQPGVRFQQTFGDVKTGMFTAAVSIENAQITNFTATSATAGAVPTNFFFAGAGQNGGLYNAYNGTYANNVAPDFIVKTTFDLPKAHFELGGLARFLRDYYYPILTDVANVYTYSPNSVSNTKAAGGVFGSVRVTTSKFADVGLSGMAGTGTGRYGSSQLADATLRPNGTLAPIKNYHALFSLETHPAPKFDVVMYYGGEYAQRTTYTTATGAIIGYGARNLNDAGCYALPANPGSSTGGSPSAPATCASPTRYIQEGLLGFVYRFVDSKKFGKLQYTVNYQYVQRNLWSGVGNATTPSGPRAVDNMVLTGLRYYIP